MAVKQTAAKLDVDDDADLTASVFNNVNLTDINRASASFENDQ